MLARKLAEVSGGSPGVALAEDPAEFAALLEEAEGAVQTLGAGTSSDRLSLAARWAGEKEKLGRRLDCLEGRLRERTARSAREGALQDGVLDSLGGVVRIRRLLDQNVNVQLALDVFFLGLLGETLEGSP